MSKRTTSLILKDADETLQTAKFGLLDLLKAEPERKLSGLRNLIVFGRAVTNVLQNLRSTEPTFDQWYLPYQEEMKNDQAMRYIYKLRSIILKQGAIKTTVYAHLKSSSELSQLSPPPGADGFFIGDELGGAGWNITLHDGTNEKYYIELPQEVGEVQMYFKDFLDGENFPYHDDNSIESISQYYIDYLSNLVRIAKEEFL